MSERTYLEGFVPYKEEIVDEYVKKRAWKNLTYGDLLDSSASQHPDKTAVVDDKNRLTYKELKERVDRFAIALLDLGIKPHDRIILQLPNRNEFIIAFYGIQKMGGVPLLAVPRHGYREVSTFFKITDAVGWILPVMDGNIKFEALVKRIRGEFDCLKYIIMPDDGGILPSTLSMDKLIREVRLDDYPENYLNQFRPDPNDVAVLKPTGGTTGLPRIVPRTHNSMIVNAECISRNNNSDDISLQATPVGHSMALTGAVTGAILKGATLVLVSVPRPTEILEAIQREKITKMVVVPTQLEGIIKHPDLDKYDVRSLKAISTAGSSLSWEIAQSVVEYFGKYGCSFLGSGLGASEGIVAKGEVETPIQVKLRTVGRNISPGSHYKIVDEEERDLPLNTEGELVVKGPEVFTGYYKTTEEENNKVFTRDGYYRTGDLAKIDESGYITITGRRKDVIIRGGETLVPSEMESLIKNHPNVDRVAVVGMPEPVMGERACAYIVTKPGKSISFNEMIDFLKSEGAGVLLLPERLEVMDQLPETAIGKIDKKALREDIRNKLKKEGVIRE